MKPKPQHASAHLFVPDGFTGWWCERCEKAVTLPEELGSPARCPRCHKPTAVWVPPSAPVLVTRPEPNPDPRPKTETARRLFDHMKEVIENPALEPDLRKIELDEYLR